MSEYGVRIPMYFPIIGDSAEPDFVLYDGETCAFVEIKSGNNINQNDIEQMKRLDDIDIETAEDALRDAKVRSKTSYDGTVSSVEPIIVYQDLDEGYIEEHIDDSDSFAEAFDEITDHSVLMTQDYGGELRVLGGEFNDEGQLQRLLKEGVELPENPPDEIMLTEQMEKEALAIAICDVWGEQSVDHEEGIVISREEVRDYFAPRHNVNPSDLELVFRFLEDFGACDQVEDEEHQYRFTRDHMNSILKVESQVMEETVMDYLQEEDQSSLDEWD